jgi:hypothetical protein
VVHVIVAEVPVMALDVTAEITGSAGGLVVVNVKLPDVVVPPESPDVTT